jgi:hypothetical protein
VARAASLCQRRHRHTNTAPSLQTDSVDSGAYVRRYREWGHVNESGTSHIHAALGPAAGVMLELAVTRDAVRHITVSFG